MGRGQNNQPISAQQLLYGRLPATPASEKRARQARRRAEAENAKITLRRSYAQAATELAAGNSEPLGQLLANPAAHGLKTVEKEEIAKLAAQACSTARDLTGNQSLAEVDDLVPLLDLVDRCSSLSSTSFSEASLAAALYGRDLANQTIIDQLDRDQDRIGSLPVVVFGKDFAEHLMKDGKIACGGEIYPHTFPYSSPAVCSALETSVDCIHCLDIYQRPGDVDYMIASDWLSELRTSDLDNWSPPTLHPLERAEGDSRSRAGQIVDSYLTISTEVVDEFIAPFADYSLEEAL